MSLDPLKRYRINEALMVHALLKKSSLKKEKKKKRDEISWDGHDT